MSKDVTIVETNPAHKQGTISIRPYFDDSKENMGLEKYGLSLFDGVCHEEQLACLEINGVKRYVTGLNEFAPEIRMIKDAEERKAAIKRIRTAVSELEKELAANIIEVDDPEFWNKVQLLRPDNAKFWDKIVLRCGNEPVFLDPVKDPNDRIRLFAIEAGGFTMIARSYEEAKKMPVAPKFYLDKLVETVALKTELKKARNKALAELQKLFDKTPKKLRMVAKVLDANSAQYKTSTPPDIIYDNMDNFINGKGVERNQMRAAAKFSETAAMDMESLTLRAIVKDAAFYKVIGTRSDGFIYHLPSSTMLGKNPMEVVEYLRNPLNENLLVEITRSVEQNWNE